MTNSQQYKAPRTFPTTLRWQAPAAGELTACDGLWLTRQGDLDDHLLQPGERVQLSRGDDVVIEALPGDRTPRWDWQPAAQARTFWRGWFGAQTTSPGCSA